MFSASSSDPASECNLTDDLSRYRDKETVMHPEIFVGLSVRIKRLGSSKLGGDRAAQRSHGRSIDACFPIFSSVFQIGH